MVDREPHADNSLGKGSTLRNKASLTTADVMMNAEESNAHWTVGQIARDTMQNHLDACSRKYFDQLVSEVCDVHELEAKVASDPEVAKKYEEFAYGMFIFSQHQRDYSKKMRHAALEKMSENARDLPLRQEYLTQSGKLNTELMSGLSERVHMELPQVSFEVETSEKEIIQKKWCTLDELKSMRSPLHPQPVITAVKVTDSGEGFDSTLATNMLPTKLQLRIYRGKFGEGGKQNERMLLKNGIWKRTRSALIAPNATTQQPKSVVWQSHVEPTTDALGNTVLRHKGVRVTSEDAAYTTGTETLLRLPKDGPSPGFRDQLVKEFSDRDSRGLGHNVLDYKSYSIFRYPVAYGEGPHLGIDTSGGNDQYVQGILIQNAADSFPQFQPLLFSYDFPANTVLQGRDRNALKFDEAKQEIQSFWRAVDDRGMIEELFSMLVLQASKGPYLESHVMQKLFEDDTFKNAQMYAHAFAKAFECNSSSNRYCIIPYLQYVDDSDKNTAEQHGYTPIPVPLALGTTAFNRLRKLLGRDAEYFTSIDEPEMQKREKKKDMMTNTKKSEARIERTALKQIVDRTFREVRDEMLFDESYNSTTRDKLGGARVTCHESFELSKFEIATNAFSLAKGHGVEIKVDLAILEQTLPAGSSQKMAVRYFLRAMLAGAISMEEDRRKEVVMRTVMFTGQPYLQSLMVASLSDDVLDQLPERFDHEHDEAALQRFKQMLERNIYLQQEMRRKEWLDYRDATKHDLTQSEAIALVEKITKEGTAGDSRAQILALAALQHRVFLDERGGIGSFERRISESDENAALVFAESSPKEVGTWEGYPVLQVSDGKYFIPCPFVEGSSLRKEIHTNEVTQIDEFFFFQGAISHKTGTTGFEFAQSHVPGSTMKAQFYLQQGGIVVTDDHGARATPDAVQKALAGWKLFTAGTEISSQKFPIVKRTQETSLTTEFTQGTWDKPLRVLHDLYQNHHDGENIEKEGGVQIVYEVERDGNRIFVPEGDLGSEEAIIGFGITDNGNGYAPHGIHVLGNTSKRSALFAGQYGEGMKLLALMALRNNLKLTYSSRAEDDKGNTVRWRAVARKQKLEYLDSGLVGGRKVAKTADKLSFDVEPFEMQESPLITSISSLTLPSDANAESQVVWQSIVAELDPRIRSEGHGGLARTVRGLRPPGSETGVYTIGAVTVLTDPLEKGKVYENGILISGGSGLAFGYDVPRVTNGRDRAGFNRQLLYRYAQEALRNAGPEHAELMLVVFERYKTTRLSDVDPDVLFDPNSFEGKVIDIADWSFVARQVMGNKYIETRNTKERGEREVYLPQESRLKVQSDSAPGWKALLFETTKDYFRQLETVEVKASDDTREKLESIALLAGKTVIEAVESLNTPQTQEMYIFIIKRVQENLRSLPRPKKDESDDMYEAFFGNNHNVTQSDAEYSLRGTYEQFATSIESGAHPVMVLAVDRMLHGVFQQGFDGSQKIGFNERRLMNFGRESERRGLTGTAIHEMIHLLTGFNDYTPEFSFILMAVKDKMEKTNGALSTTSPRRRQRRRGRERYQDLKDRRAMRNE